MPTKEGVGVTGGSFVAFWVRRFGVDGKDGTLKPLSSACCAIESDSFGVFLDFFVFPTSCVAEDALFLDVFGALGLILASPLLAPLVAAGEVETFVLLDRRRFIIVDLQLVREQWKQSRGLNAVAFTNLTFSIRNHPRKHCTL